MKKTSSQSLRKSADTLISMTTRMIEALETAPSCDAKDLERLSGAFLNALEAVSSLKEPPKKKSAPKEKEEKECGTILLPPVMECDE